MIVKHRRKSFLANCAIEVERVKEVQNGCENRIRTKRPSPRSIPGKLGLFLTTNTRMYCQSVSKKEPSRRRAPCLLMMGMVYTWYEQMFFVPS